MFSCSKCKSLEAEISFLRGVNEKLVDRLVGAPLQAAQPAVPMDPNEFYGTSDQDQVITYDDFGQKMLVSRKQPQ